MRLLIANALRDESTNPFLFLLIRSLSRQQHVTLILHGVPLFWYHPFEIEIVHIHQPEFLFDYKEPTISDLNKLKTQLLSWKKYAKIVVTIHNRYPHYRDTQNFRELYRIVYEHADGFTHRSITSLEEFNTSYPNLTDRPSVIIPAGINTYFRNEISRADARQKLGLSEDEQVILSFGSIRAFEELEQVVRGFHKADVPRKKLIISAMVTPYKQNLRKRLYETRFHFSPNIQCYFEKIPADDVQVLMNAADIVIIPRVQVLNSANIQLGFGFGKVVVGPDDGVVGEILRTTGNPVFHPNEPDSVAQAIESALQLNKEGVGEQNRLYAQANWDWDIIAAKHVDFFSRVLSGAR